jgi:protocatechuate 3,4-dioxygenase beta subunit
MVALRIEGDGIEHRAVRVVATPGFDPKSVSPPIWSPAMPGLPRPPGPPLYGPEFVHAARPTQPIVGTVRDRQTGRPLAGIRVGASVNPGSGWYEDAVSTRTDADGRFRAVGLPKVPHRQVYLNPGDNSPYMTAGYKVPDADGLGPITLDLQLVRGVVLRGRVTETATGRPVKGAGVFYHPLADNAHVGKVPGSDIHQMSGYGCSADADGRFRLVVVPGPGLITAQAETRGGGTAHPYTQVRLDPADRPRAYLKQVDTLGEAIMTFGGVITTLSNLSAYKIIDPPAGTEELSIDLTFATGRSVRGTVLDADGKPLAGCTAGGLTATYDQPQVLKDATFTAVALDPDRPRTVIFLHRERQLAGTVKLSGAEPTPPAIKLGPCGAITGRVLDADGTPVAGARVAVNYRENAVDRLDTRGTYPREEFDTDADGRFRITGLIPGERFGVGFKVKGRLLDAGTAVRDLTVAPGEAKDLGDIATKPYRE